MNYSEMPAGRKMDAAVAEKVMEREICDKWITGPGLHAVWVPVSYTKRCDHDNCVPQQHVPQFSTDVSAAFQVVEQMWKKGYWLELKSPFFEGESWWAGFTPRSCSGWNGEPDHNMPGEGAAVAICRSALSAMAELEA